MRDGEKYLQKRTNGKREELNSVREQRERKRY